MTEYEINGKDYTVEYDLDNRIVKVEVDNDDVEYRYDAFGRRVIRKEGSTNTSLIWWGNSECAEHKHQAGTTVIQNDIMEHPSRLNSVIARAVDGSKFKLEWYHKNYLDHVYAVSDDSGDILEHYRYTAFGEVTIYNELGNQVSTTQIDNHILWNTRRRDEVTGYYMYKFRHYSPELGRWPSRDPIEESGGVNLYGFVINNPVGRWDILGLNPLAPKHPVSPTSNPPIPISTPPLFPPISPPIPIEFMEDPYDQDVIDYVKDIMGPVIPEGGCKFKGYRVDGWHTTWTSRWRRLYVKCSCKCVVCGTKHAFVVLPFEVEVDGDRYEQAGYFGNDHNVTPYAGPPTNDAIDLGNNVGDLIEAANNAHNNGVLSYIEKAMSTSKHGEKICSKLKVKCDKTGKKEAYE